MTKAEMLEEMKLLLDWKIKKMEQCKQCKIGQKKIKDELAALKSALNGVALLGAEEEGCGCGGNCQVEGADCEC